MNYKKHILTPTFRSFFANSGGKALDTVEVDESPTLATDSTKLPKFDKRIFIFFCAIFCLLLSITTLLMTSKLLNPTIRSDGMGYYLYLPSAFIYHDLTMQWTQPLQKEDHYSDPHHVWYGLTTFRKGAYLDGYPIGLAILWLPFFIAAHIMSILTGHPATGFTVWYQAAIGFAAAFYTSLGCVMIYKLLRRYYSVKVSYFTVLTLLLGTNMLEYATHASSFTHVYSLFLIATILYLTPTWYKNMTYRTSILLAALLALNVLVRPINILILIVLLLWNITNLMQLRQRIVLLWQQRIKLVLMAGIGLITFFPQSLYWKYITGKWLIYSYGDAGFTNVLRPQIINILFSTERGVFFWAPVLLLSLIGLVLLRRHLKEWSTPIYVFLPVWLWLMASWVSWPFGDSYGHRAFIDIFPLLGLALATVYSRAKPPTARKTLLIFVGLCIFANLFLTYQYWIWRLPAHGTTLQIYINIWRLGLAPILHNGFTFGFLGLIGLISIILGPLTHYFLVTKEQRRYNEI